MKICLRKCSNNLVFKLLSIVMLFICGSAQCSNIFKVPNDLEERFKDIPDYVLLKDIYSEEIEELLTWKGENKGIQELGLFLFDLLDNAYDKGRDSCCCKIFSRQDLGEKMLLDRSIVCLAGIMMGENLQTHKIRNFDFSPLALVSA
ncbi:MAG: hypothetical protein AB8G05_18635 [Oligoflexales bacterium]